MNLKDQFKIPLMTLSLTILESVLIALPANADLSIKIDLNERFLYLINHSEELATIEYKYPIAIGDPRTPTPTGSYKIMRKENQPIY